VITIIKKVNPQGKNLTYGRPFIYYTVGVGGSCVGCTLSSQAVYEEGKPSNAPLRYGS
jgi:hypothetical protein